jgi:hypothetical protein
VLVQIPRPHPEERYLARLEGWATDRNQSPLALSAVCVFIRRLGRLRLLPRARPGLRLAPDQVLAQFPRLPLLPSILGARFGITNANVLGHGLRPLASARDLNGDHAGAMAMDFVVGADSDAADATRDPNAR